MIFLFLSVDEAETILPLVAVLPDVQTRIQKGLVHEAFLPIPDFPGTLLVWRDSELALSFNNEAAADAAWNAIRHLPVGPVPVPKTKEP